MPYCPKCKMEYQDGITICSDCKIALVDELKHPDMECVYAIKNETVFTRLTKYLEFSNIPFETDTNPESGALELYCLPKYRRKVEQSFKTLVSVEAVGELSHYSATSSEANSELEASDELQAYSELTEDMTEDAAIDGEAPLLESLIEEDAVNDMTRVSMRGGTVYESMEHKASESSSSGIMLIVCSILGIGFIFLNMIGTLTFFGSTFSQCILLAFFVILFGLGVFSIRAARIYREKAVIENQNVEQLKQWLSSTYTKETLMQSADSSLSGEEQILVWQKDMTDNAIEQFQDIDETTICYFVDEFFNQNFSDLDDDESTII